MYRILAGGFVVLMTVANLWVLFKLVQPELQVRTCVPLYNETGYECCQ